MKTYKKLLSVLLIFINLGTFAQDTSFIETNYEDAQKNRLFQVTFVSPLGTNGLESGNITNNFSLNIIAGYSGGLDGVEIGGFSNIVNGNVKGAQFAGFTNIVNGTTSGAQFSGFTNIVRNDLTGGQFTGFSNLVIGDVDGIQVSGFTNVAKGDLKTVQLTGFANIVNGKTDGAQISGFTNVSRKKMSGFQLAGFSNLAGNDANGVQISGFSNTVKDTLTGFQLSGFINIAKHVKGSQLGFINICDTIENGIPLVFISIVKNGYHKFEIGGGESFYINASLKLGVSKFYNIFSIGAKPYAGTLIWGPGYGVGTEFKLNDKFNLNMDLISYLIFDSEHNWNNEPWETGNWDYEFSSLNKLSLIISRQFSKHLSLYGGPSFNITVSNETNNEGELVGTNIAPWSLYSRIYRETMIDMYPGFRAGIRF